MVRSIARNYRGHGVDAADLIGEGFLALVRAADDYDPVRHPNTAFRDFARRRVVAAMGHALEKAGVFRLPIRLERAARKCRAVRAELEALGVYRPTWQEIGERIGLDPGTVRECLSVTPSEISVDEFVVYNEAVA